MIEAHVHGLPTPTVKFYRDGHLLHARKNKIVFFLEDKEIFQCLLVRPDASVSGMYTILAENKAGKKRFNHHVDFVTKYPLIHLPGMRHADKKLDDFVEEMLEKIPKHLEEPAVPVVEIVTEENKANAEITEAPKAEEIAEALQVVVDGDAPKSVVDGETPQAEEVKVVEKPKKHKSKSKHRKKAHKAPQIDDDLVNDGEDEPPTDEIEGAPAATKRKFSAAPAHEPYEEETFRIYNAKNSLWFSGKLRDQTAIEGTTIKLLCAVSGPMPIMKWLKNGKPVSWGNNMRNMTGEGLGLVIIDKITKADAGTYTCTATNPTSEAITETVIKVIPKSSVPRTDTSKPFFSRVLGEFYHITEDDLILDAHVRAVPEPSIVWYKDGIEINAATDIRFDFSSDHDGGYQFRIHAPKASDSALYACEAVNSEGKAKVTHKVIFTELERHTHPQFVYHKESFWQPTLKMSIEPELTEPAADINQVATKIVQAAARTDNGSNVVLASQDSGNSDNQEPGENGTTSNGDATGGSGSGGDGNEDGEENNNGTKDVPDDADEEEKEEKQEKKRRPKSSRRKRFEGPVEPLLIRDSVME